jgi:hypothetical protein
MSPLFRKSPEKRAAQAAAQAEITRLKALGPDALAVLVAPALGTDGVAKGQSVRVQQLVDDLMRDFPGAGMVINLQLMAAVNAALERLHDAALVERISLQRSPVYRITALGSQALAAGDIEQRLRGRGP